MNRCNAETWPDDYVWQEIVRALAMVMTLPKDIELTPDVRMNDLGIESFHQLNLVFLLEECFDVDVLAVQSGTVETLGQIHQVLSRLIASHAR